MIDFQAQPDSILGPGGGFGGWEPRDEPLFLFDAGAPGDGGFCPAPGRGATLRTACEAAGGPPDPAAFQVPPKPALWALLLALLGLAPVPARPRGCSVPDVLRHYRAVILEDLQAAVRRAGLGAAGSGPGSRHLHLPQRNQTRAAAARRRGRLGPSCGAQKEHGILASIASLGQTLRSAAAGRRRGALEKAAWTVALRTEAVMRRHCRTPRQRSRRRRPQTHQEPRPHGGGRRRLLLRTLNAVATCWEKLFALRAWAHGSP
ncbi:uncharacterized protein C20orf204 homolog [Pteronotus mesoamericanus]|uniref:uncharacterized protein C20orf204 homolog n=1 Tax=Pteronotus mesoamericanus TaxID=1884717 RepID=UPI0023EDDC80|nr:uncharacterized protein C20orf204 homolog [Pteronotus parnellii mesoamericanus]